MKSSCVSQLFAKVTLRSRRATYISDAEESASHHNGKKAFSIVTSLQLPNINWLRSIGTTFPHGAVVPSPVCAPSRACMTSLREYDKAGVASNSYNDYKADEIPTYF